VVLWWAVLVVIALCLTYSIIVISTTLQEQSSLTSLSIPPSSRQYHMVFSTSCDPFQDWQSLAFFYFAHRIQQPGHITRIVSGCTPEQAQARQVIHEQKIAPLNPQYYHLHVTPDYGHGQGSQKYWNKPFGLLSYLETTLGYSKTVVSTLHDNDIVLILDPDMMLLKPITDDFSNYVGMWTNDLQHTTVQHGLPIAQRYEYGSQW
jgi:peptidyl serine alpha-galactosyltransferase